MGKAIKGTAAALTLVAGLGVSGEALAQSHYTRDGSTLETRTAETHSCWQWVQPVGAWVVHAEADTQAAQIVAETDVRANTLQMGRASEVGPDTYVSIVAARDAMIQQENSTGVEIGQITVIGGPAAIGNKVVEYLARNLNANDADGDGTQCDQRIEIDRIAGATASQTLEQSEQYAQGNHSVAMEIPYSDMDYYAAPEYDIAR